MLVGLLYSCQSHSRGFRSLTQFDQKNKKKVTSSREKLTVTGDVHLGRKHPIITVQILSCELLAAGESYRFLCSGHLKGRLARF